MIGLTGLAGWAWTLTVLGAFMRDACARRPVPASAGEVSLPAYVLLAPIVFVASVSVIQSTLALEWKILARALLGVGGSLMAAAVLSRISVLRPLLGLRRPSVRIDLPQPASRRGRPPQRWTE